MSIILYKERLFADASYYLFKAINSGWFHVEHGRIVLGISQLLPLLGSYLALPLKVILVFASVGHELFYYAIFLILLYKLKDQSGAVAVLLIHLIGQLWLYYSPMLEICYGAALAVLFYSILRSEKCHKDHWLILLLIVQWFVMTSHLENFLLIAVIVAYDLINRGIKKRVHYAVMGFFLIGLAIEFLTFSSYELAKVSLQNETASITNLAEVSYLADLGKLFISYFPELVAFSSVLLLYLILRKRWKKLCLFIAAIFALILAVNRAAFANEFTRYYESMYNPLVFIIVFFFLYEIYQEINPQYKRVFQTGVVLIALVRIFWIWDYGKPLQQRSTQMERVVDYAQTVGHSKYLINKENYEKDYSYVAWSNPIETLLYSAIDGKDQSLSIATFDDYYYHNNHRALTDSSYLFRMFEIVDYDFLNPRYFQLKKQPYQRLNNSGFEIPIEEMAANTLISFSSSNSEIYYGSDTTYLSIEIENKNKVKIPSAKEDQVFLSYHIYQNGKEVLWDGLRTPLEVNVFGLFKQDIRFIVPKHRGVYEVVPDIVVEGKAWFNSGKRYKIAVVD